VTRLDEAVREMLAMMPAPPEVSIMRRRRRRRRRYRTALIGLIVVAAVGAAAALKPTSSPARDVRIHVAQSNPATQPSTASTSTTEVTFAAGVPAPVDTTAPEPSHFFAAIGAGGERIALVDAATGTHGPYLTPPSQALVRFSNDLKTIYEPTADAGCGHTWTAVDVATDTTRPAFQDLGNPVDVVESPDGNKIAYVRPLGAPLIPGCKGQELVVRDTATGHQRLWTEPSNTSNDDETITQLNWSPDSAHLAYNLNVGRNSTARVLDINSGTTLTDGLQLRSPDPACSIATPRFRPGTDLIVAAENCEGHSAQLLDINATTGAVTNTVPIATGPIFGIVDLAVDASGTHVLYVLDGTTNQPSEVYTLRNGKPAPLLSDAYEVAW
jgi:dipeptidyl aminopeptidase/acylaminoacyl peptidase